MVIDYESAWHRLGEHIASKTQHGREATLVEMQSIAAECRVPAGELSRLLRLYGVEVERLRASIDRDEPSPSDADGRESGAGGGTEDSPASLTPGGHHGGRNGRTAAAAAR